MFADLSLDSVIVNLLSSVTIFLFAAFRVGEGKRTVLDWQNAAKICQQISILLTPPPYTLSFTQIRRAWYAIESPGLHIDVRFTQSAVKLIRFLLVLDAAQYTLYYSLGRSG